MMLINERSQVDKDFILFHTDKPYSIENCVSKEDIEELIDVWENSDNKEHKNTGPITSKIKNFNNPALSRIRDLIYFGDHAGDIEIWYAFFFHVDKPHIIHIDDSIDTLPKIFKAFTIPLRIEGGDEEPYLMFFDQFYLDGPSKFFNGDSQETKGHHEDLQFSKLPRSMCVYEYSNVIGTTQKPFETNLPLDHIKDEWLKGLSYNSAHKWKPGNIIVFDSCRLHCASDFRKVGISSKLGISVFTKHK